MKESNKQEAHSKHVIRGTMNEEELRMNKTILKEISAAKKQDRMSKLGST
jgi:hypothetical protein